MATKSWLQVMRQRHILELAVHVYFKWTIYDHGPNLASRYFNVLNIIIYLPHWIFPGRGALNPIEALLLITASVRCLLWQQLLGVGATQLHQVNIDLRVYGCLTNQKLERQSTVLPCKVAPRLLIPLVPLPMMSNMYFNFAMFVMKDY